MSAKVARSLVTVLMLGSLLLLSHCGVVVRSVHRGVTAFSDSSLFHQGRHGELNEREKEWAKIAWRYFENNYNPQTGLVNSVDGYAFTTMWHVGDYIAALVAAHALQIIKTREFDERFSKLLNFLNSMSLFADKLPNKGYSALHGGMVNYNNQPEETGWSAIDLGRLLIWLKIARERYPQFAEYIDKAVLRWHFCDVVERCGTLYGGSKVEGKIALHQEGRLGYEEYAAMGYQAWSFDTREASKLEPYDTVNIHGVDIVYDSRDPRLTGVQAPVVSLPYILHGLEFNWDKIDDHASSDKVHTDHQMADLAARIYRVQEARHAKEKIVTARTDHLLSKPPFLVYDTIFAGGYAWNTVSPSGDPFPHEALVSVRAVFGLWVLWKTAYTEQLLGLVEAALFNPDRGWYEGRLESTGGYEETISCTTNAVVLEALLYKTIGKIYQVTSETSHYQILLKDEFSRPGQCFPPEREQCK